MTSRASWAAQPSRRSASWRRVSVESAAGGTWPNARLKNQSRRFSASAGEDQAGKGIRGVTATEELGSDELMQRTERRPFVERLERRRRLARAEPIAALAALHVRAGRRPGPVAARRLWACSAARRNVWTTTTDIPATRKLDHVVAKKVECRADVAFEKREDADRGDHGGHRGRQRQPAAEEQARENPAAA